MMVKKIGIYGVSNPYVWTIVWLAEELGFRPTLVANLPVNHFLGCLDVIHPEELTKHQKSRPFFPGVVRPASKKKVVAEAEGHGITFLSSLVSKHAVVGSFVEIGKSNIVRPLVVIDPYCSLGDHVTLSPGVTLGHHVSVGAYSHLANGVTVSGNVRVGERVFIGVGAVVRDGISIGDDATIGMGAVVVEDVDPATIVVGNPARLQK